MDQHAAGVVACAVGSALAGWAGQHWLKSNPGFNTSIAHAAQFSIAFVLYVIGNPLAHNGDPATWLMVGMTWAGSAIAFGSQAAAMGLAAKTDSKP